MAMISFEAVGITPLEERIYRMLVEQRAAQGQDIERACGAKGADVDAALHALEEKGLVSVAPGAPRRFMAAPPEVALEVLVLKKREELERVRLAAAALATTFHDVANRQSDALVVEAAGKHTRSVSNSSSGAPRRRS